MKDDIRLNDLSREVAHRRKGLRVALQERHKTSLGQAQVRLSNLYDWTARMARKIKQENGKQLVKPDFRGFFNTEIPLERKGECKAFIREDEQVAVLIEEAVAALYKISFSRNEKNDSIVAAMQCNDSNSPNAGLVMSAHAAHWYDAVAVLVWKHFVLLEQKWKEPDLAPDDDFG